MNTDLMLQAGCDVMFTTLMQNIPDSVFYKMYDGEKFVFVCVNNAKAARSGVTPEEMYGKTDESFMTYEDAMNSFDTDMRAYGGEIVHDYIERITRADGSISWVSVTKAPLQDPTGNTFGILGIARDITQRMEELERNREIEELVRVEIHSVLHGIKNILVGYGGFIGRIISLLKKGKVEQCLSVLPSRRDEILAYEQNVKSMNLRISQLGISKPELPETESVFDLRIDVFDKLISRHDQRMNELNIQWDGFMGLIPEGKYVLKTVKDYLAFAIDSTIDNQVKYGETITRMTFGAEVDIPQKQLVINVSSDGVRINEEFARTKLFQKGQRAKDTSHKEGTGFGLYTAREFIRSLGGEMEYVPVVADDWMGFVIILPLSVLQNEDALN